MLTMVPPSPRLQLCASCWENICLCLKRQITEGFKSDLIAVSRIHGGFEVPAPATWNLDSISGKLGQKGHHILHVRTHLNPRPELFVATTANQGCGVLFTRGIQNPERDP